MLLWLESWRTSFSCTSLKVISLREAAVSKHCKCRSQMNRSILLPLCWSDSNGFYFELHACQGNSSPLKVPSVGKRPGEAERSLTFSPRNWDVFRPSPSAQSSTTWCLTDSTETNFSCTLWFILFLASYVSQNEQRNSYVVSSWRLLSHTPTTT